MTHTTDPHHDALMAISGALDAGEQAAILARLAPLGSRLHGAQVADLLDMLDQHDFYLDKIEPFYEDNAALLPQVAGTRYALYALIALDRELTPLNLAKMLIRAGLMPQRESRLTWQAYVNAQTGATTGHQATGADLHYLVFPHPQGSAYQLTRYPRDITFPETVIEAASYAVCLSTPDEGRRFAELYEAGEDIPEIGWYHGTPPTGMSTT